ncbi:MULTISPECIES: MFS transporter [Pseudonocardia]|uniref:Putative proline/betaine transporter n=1 Tax=Pseudonocardia alni TaxID=33907 RepID=A0A852VSK4_PSEA5|nr:MULTISPECIES: MFS transporter [Pseudonocardia]MCO7193023.1 MHS family MFS transporter [Pseudonocardia sp. McavD-2-B]NYF99872.1 MFS family permease [Pseudonocardia antarctica]
MSQQPSAAAPSAPQAQPTRAALAAWIGSALEYYDFFIYGTAAALVFNKVFFPDSSPVAGTLLSLATFGFGYVARPLGAVLFGHIGDRLGRKKVLVATLMMMGVATLAIGFLPTYDQVGVLAPALLVTCRLLQGLSAGGEQAGANSMTLEHSPQGRRAFFTSFTLSGTQGGQIIATAVFLPIALLPEDALLSWGWRVPFWASVLVMVAGVLIRRTLHETPVFTTEVADTDGAPKAKDELPIAALFRGHWPNLLRVTLAATVASVSTLMTVFALSFAVNTVGLERSTMLWVVVSANVVALAAIPLFAVLADRIGRRPVFIAGALGSGVLLAAYLWAVSTGEYLLVFGIGILLSGIVYSAANGVWPSFYGEMFPARVRLTGMAVGTQIGFAFGGFAPTIAAALAANSVSGWLPVAVFGGVICLVAAASAWSARETAHLSLDEIEAGFEARDRVPARV